MRRLILFVCIILLFVSPPTESKETKARNRAPRIAAILDANGHVQLSWKRTKQPLILERRLQSEPAYQTLAQLPPRTTFFIDSSLAFDQPAFYRLLPTAARYFSEFGEETAILPEISPPPAPLLMRVAADSVEIGIAAMHPSAEQVIVERRIRGVFEQVGIIPDGNRSFVEKVPTGRLHRYRLYYKSGFGASKPSPVVSIEMNLSSPLDITLSPISDETVRVSWSPGFAFDCEYEIEKRGPGEIARYRTARGAREWIDAKFRQGDVTLYRVRAVCENDSSAMSAPVAGNFELLPISDLRTDSLHDEQVSLYWNTGLVPAARHAVERSADSLQYVTLAELSGEQSTFRDTTVVRGKKYFYRITSFGSSGKSVSSPVLTEKIPALTENMVLISSSTGRDFFMDALEVTAAQYAEFCAVTRRSLPDDPGFTPFPDYWQNPQNYPAVNVSWRDAVEFCNWRSLIAGLIPAYDSTGIRLDSANGYLLPARAEFEQAHSFAASEISNLLGSEDGLEFPAGIETASLNSSQVYHLIGNVWEWSEDTSADSARLVLGGSYCTPAGLVQEIPEFVYLPNYRSPTIGFRCILRK